MEITRKNKRADLKSGLPSYSRMEVNLFLMFHGPMIIKRYEEIMNGMRRIYEKLPEATQYGANTPSGR
jgi:hypothetical protein